MRLAPAICFGHNQFVYMGVFGKIIIESIRQALQQLQGNRLRSFLSLVGISIGIFCIIGVLSAVDSLEDNIRGSMDKLGNDILYVKKWPWDDFGDNWWKYFRRPHPTHEEYEVVRQKSRYAQLTSFHVVIGFRTVKWNANSVEQSVAIAASEEFADMFSIPFAKGRYFSPAEYQYGANKIILGYKVAQALFGAIEPMGKTVKLQGKPYEVIGVIETSGDALLNPLDFDDCIIVSYNNGRNLANLRNANIFDATICAKTAEGVALEQMRDEIRGILRAERRLKPRAEESFSLNQLSMIGQVFDQFFLVLNLLGIVIGAFSMLVGGVSVANIMFVSVKERTNIIGIKKALGAKRYIILLEFLTEAIILCILGGALGLGLVWLITQGLTAAFSFAFYMDVGNIMLGVSVSVIIGVVSGIIPAMQAARLDPVEAMRQ